MADEISAVTYPTISIRGVAYPVKFSNAAYYRLEKAGLELPDVAAKLKSGRLGVALVYDLLAASIGHGFTGEMLAEVIEISVARDAVVAALGKVQPSPETKLREPATADVPTPAN